MSSYNREKQPDGTWVYQFLPEERTPRDLSQMFRCRITEMWDNLEAKGLIVEDSMHVPEDIIQRIAREYNGKAVFVTEIQEKEQSAEEKRKRMLRDKHQLECWIENNPDAVFAPGFDINKIFK